MRQLKESNMENSERSEASKLLVKHLRLLKKHRKLEIKLGQLQHRCARMERMLTNGNKSIKVQKIDPEFIALTADQKSTLSIYTAV